MTDVHNPHRNAEQLSPQWDQRIDHHLDELFQELEQALSQKSLPIESAPRGGLMGPVVPEGQASLVPQPFSAIVAEADLEASLQLLYRPLEARLETSPSPQFRQRQPLFLLPAAKAPPLINSQLLFGMACASWIMTFLLWMGSQFQVTPPSTSQIVTRNPAPASPQPVPLSPQPLPVQPAPLPVVTVPPLPRVAPAPPPAPPPVARVDTPTPPPPPPVSVAPAPAQVETPAAAPPVPAVSEPPAPVPLPASNHVLTGLMALGDRSVALITVEGVAQQVKVGDIIDASGWQLLEVTEDSAVLQRQGEQRSVRVGQSF